MNAFACLNEKMTVLYVCVTLYLFYEHRHWQIFLDPQDVHLAPVRRAAVGGLALAGKATAKGAYIQNFIERQMQLCDL